MNSITPRVWLVVAACAAPGLLRAQFDFKIDGRPVQVHSFASQGFAYSNDNNYLTMKTSQGSAALTDFGFSLSTQITDKFRVGAQFYDRNVGNLGNFHPELDWAMGDYRFRDWFGIRGGKVKTVLGLYNDTQDLEFLHTWALMPQALYPMDVRSDMIAHVGGDVYGTIGMKRMGSISYTGWAGRIPNDSQGGFLYGFSTSSRVATPDGGYKFTTGVSKILTSYGGWSWGGDLRWCTPLKGLTAGVSGMRQHMEASGKYVANNLPYHLTVKRNFMAAYYLEYAIGNLRLAGEYRRQPKLGLYNSAAGAPLTADQDARGGYISAAYRISKWLELGTYHARFVRDWRAYHDDPQSHIFDQAVTARFDLTRFLDWKVEGHFMDGAMIDSLYDRGFYAAANPAGITPKTNMLVMRLGFHM
jgi:hypothetical protein